MFANTLKKVLYLDNNKIKEISENAYGTWKKEYTIQNMVDGLEKVYTLL